MLKISIAALTAVASYHADLHNHLVGKKSKDEVDKAPEDDKPTEDPKAEPEIEPEADPEVDDDLPIAPADPKEVRMPWTCQQLESSTTAFYRMFPAYLGRAVPDETNKAVLKDVVGRCFQDITVTAIFDLQAEDHLSAAVTFNLDDNPTWCAEHLQISTALSDVYNFYVTKG